MGGLVYLLYRSLTFQYQILKYNEKKIADNSQFVFHNKSLIWAGVQL